MRIQLPLVALLAVPLASVARADDWQPEPGFRSPFNGRDLTGWCFRAKADRNSPKAGEVTEMFDGKTESSDAGRYSARDGVLTVNFPKGREQLISALHTVEESPRDFTLKLESRASANADSGTFIRKPQPQSRDYAVARGTRTGEVPESEFKLPETGPIGIEGDRGRMEYRRTQIR